MNIKTQRYICRESEAVSHTQSADGVEELEESVWSVVRQENERTHQGEGVQSNGKTGTDVRDKDMGVEEDTGK